MSARTLLALCLCASAAWAQTVSIGSGASEEVGANAQVVLSADGVTVLSGGTFKLVGSSASSLATFTGPTQRAPIEVESGGTIDILWARLENLAHLHPASGAKILRLHDSTFTDLAGAPLETCEWIDLSALQSADRENLPFSFNRVSFIDIQTPPSRVNVRSGDNTPLVRMLGNGTAHGNRWGESFDNDASARIAWNSNGVTRSSDSVTFDTLHDALKNAGTTSSVTLTVTLGANAYIDESIDWNNADYGGRPDATGPTIRNACLAPMTGAAFDDTDAGAATRGKLDSVAIARGDARETTFEGVTAFPAAGGAMTVANCAGARVLLGSTVTQSGNSFSSVLATATSGFFVSSPFYDLHLASPGGNAAIDEAPAGTPGALDWEGQTRGTGQKAGGTTAWDYGADEYISGVAVPVLSHSTNTASSIAWAWSNIPNETGYKLYNGSHGGGETLVIQVAADVTTYTEPSLLENTKYIHHVHGVDAGGELPGSTEHAAYTSVHDPLSTDFTLTNPGGNTVNVSVVAFPQQSQALSARKIERSPNGAAGWFVVQDWTNATSTFVETVPGGTWYYRIRFRNGDGDPTAYSPVKSIAVTGDATPPAPPSDLVAIPGAGQITLEWIGGTETDLAGYNVYRGTTPGSYGSPLNGSLIPGTSYIDTTPVADTTYYYVVRAKDTVGNESGNSNEVSSAASASGTLPPPQNLTVTALNAANHLRWDAVDAAVGYRVYRATAIGGPYTQISPAGKLVTDTQYRDSGLVNGTTYYYRVKAVK
jgi:hypothetical protein